MYKPIKPEAEAVRNELEKARRAHVPNLAEIRKYRELLMEYVVEYAAELMEGNSNEETYLLPVRVKLRVIENDSPTLSAPSGICSPIKTDEIKQFEESVRAVFGDIESCTTAW